MMGVDSGSMLTPSVLISTETEDGHACKGGGRAEPDEEPSGRKQQQQLKEAQNGHYVLAREAR